MTVLFLYSEIATYFTSSCEELAKHCNVHVLRFPVNKEAPFTFSSEGKTKFYERSNYNLDTLFKLVDSINPDIIFCSGWIDKDYLKVCKTKKKEIPVVLCMDTKWKGGLKQMLAVIASPFTIQKYFSHAWVPGEQQAQYARKLGFRNSHISKGYYCADTDLFTEFYTRFSSSKKLKFPKRLLYVGRYYDFKGIKDLWEAFIQMQQENSSEWELWCLGTGDIEPIEHPMIKHFGFVQPNEMERFIADTGVFVLPSRFEPWAVVVHEYAAAGYPMILSDQVGAGEAFLENNENGLIFKAGDISDLKEKLQKITAMSDESLILMGEKSVELAGRLNKEKWAKTALNFLKNEN